MAYKLRPYQQEASDRAVEFFTDRKVKYNAIEVLPTGCHAKGTKIMMYDGTLKAVEDIQVSDKLMGNDSTPRKVLELHRGRDRMYRITPVKGNPFVVNGGHILHLSKSCLKKPSYLEISVSDFLNLNKTQQRLHKLHRAEKVNFHGKDEQWPYLLGLLLGDGWIQKVVGITTRWTEVVEYIYQFADENNLKVTKHIKKNNKSDDYRLASIRRAGGGCNKVINWLRDLGLVGCGAESKFIPKRYLVSSEQTRLNLLAGLVDTDTFYDKESNYYEYSTKSYRLAKGVQFLCRSLGMMAEVRIKKVNGKIYYRINISGDIDKIPSRVAVRRASKRKQKKRTTVTGFSVEYVGMGDYYGFTTDRNHLYLDSQFFVHHNSGKSLVIADIASRLSGGVVVFCPSKEILEQNYDKMCSYGLDCSLYSASAGKKELSSITLVTIGSVKGCKELFQQYKYIIVDECHLCNPKQGLYKEFFDSVKSKILGLTATPYRLCSYQSFGSMLKFLTRTNPKIFSKVIYYVQIKELLDKGYLASLNYYDCSPKDWTNDALVVNSTGADYTDKSVQAYYERIHFCEYLISIVRRLLHPKDGTQRRGILVFTRFVKEAKDMCDFIPNSAYITGKTSKKMREDIIRRFRSGEIKVVANAGCLVAGFDYPELDTIVIGKPTMSLAWYYQVVGRAIRPHETKKAGWIVDLCRNVKRFGEVKDFELRDEGNGKWVIVNKAKPLTNVFFT